MLRSELQGDESVRVAVVRSSPQIGRFIRVPIRADCFRFGSVKGRKLRREVGRTAGQGFKHGVTLINADSIKDRKK